LCIKFVPATRLNDYSERSVIKCA